MMRIEIFSALTQELEKIWCDFEIESLCTPFQSYAWLSHWHNSIGGPLHSVKPQVVLVKTNGKLMAIFPLGIRKSMGIFILEWLGGDQSDYMGPLLGRKWIKLENDFLHCWQNVIKKLDHFDVIHFQKQKEYIGNLKNPFVVLLNCFTNFVAFQANLHISWKEHYEKTVNTKLRSDSRRQRRRLSNRGELLFEVAESKEMVKKLISKMIVQKSRRYRDTGVWDMLSVPEHKTFFEKLVNIPDDQLHIHCSAFLVGEKVVATHVGIIEKDTFYYLMPAHEGGEWEKYSPGRLLLEHLMEWSIQNKLKVFDFTVGGEQYKKDWCDTETKLFETLEAVTFKGKIYTFTHRTKYYIKKRTWLSSQARKINVWMKNENRLIR